MLYLFFDGGSKGNPGPAAYGFVVKLNETTIHEEGKKLEEYTTNNIAEYQGLCNGLMWIARNCDNIHDKNLIIVGDSQLVINQMTKKYAVKSQSLKKYYSIANKLVLFLYEKDFKINFEWRERKFNSRADALLNKALQQY